MLSNEAAAVVMEALSELRLDPDQSFTAYDVTKTARSLTDENIRHSEVRDLIHALYENDFLEDYYRNTHTFWVDGRQETAQLFTPLNADPTAYDPKSIQIKKRPRVITSVQGFISALDADSVGAIGVTGFIAADPDPVGLIGSTGITALPCDTIDKGDTDPSIPVPPFTPISKPIPAAPRAAQPIRPAGPDTFIPSSSPIIDPMRIVQQIKDRISRLPIPRLWKDNK